MKYYIIASVICLSVLGYQVSSLVNINKELQNQEKLVVRQYITEEQVHCLAKNIYYEARNQSYYGQVAVAQVTINRMNSGLYPNDICKVVYQKYQFSWTINSKDKKKNFNKKDYHESYAVAKDVLVRGVHIPKLDNALYYHTTSIKPKWSKKMTVIGVIGSHIFYS